MCITVSLGETGRRRFALATTVLNIMLVFLSVLLFVAALGVRYKLDDRLDLLEGYDPGALPYYLMIAAGLLFVGHLVAAKVCRDAAHLATRSERHHRFLTLILVLIALAVFVLITEIVTWAHYGKIWSSLEDGIGNSIRLYKSDLARKQMVDALQMEFQCCGVESYQDWFSISWINLAYVAINHPDVKPFLKDGELIKDDAPFSCCSRQAKRACVHHGVKTHSRHRRYDDVTLNKLGCVQAVAAYFKGSILVPTALLLLLIFVLQAIAIVLMRLLQTSIFSAYEMNDPEGAGDAYCIKGLGGGGDNRDYFKRKQNNGDEANLTEENEDLGRPKGADRGRVKPHGRYERTETDDDEDDDHSEDGLRRDKKQSKPKDNRTKGDGDGSAGRDGRRNKRKGANDANAYDNDDNIDDRKIMKRDAKQTTERDNKKGNRRSDRQSSREEDHGRGKKDKEKDKSKRSDGKKGKETKASPGKTKKGTIGDQKKAGKSEKKSAPAKKANPKPTKVKPKPKPKPSKAKPKPAKAKPKPAKPPKPKKKTAKKSSPKRRK